MRELRQQRPFAHQEIRGDIGGMLRRREILALVLERDSESDLFPRYDAEEAAPLALEARASLTADHRVEHAVNAGQAW